jgi:hypothetical protein
MSWRDAIKIHPATDLFPMLADDELVALGEDIKRNGLTSPIAVTAGAEATLVDGRNRLAALYIVGLRVRLERSNTGQWKLLAEEQLPDGRWVGMPLTRQIGTTVLVISDDPVEYITSVNIHRRHLTQETKRELIAKLLQENPRRSDRATAELVKVDHKTVAAVRRKEVDVGSIPHVAKRIDTKGRQQPTNKAKSTSKPKSTDRPEPSPATTMLTGMPATLVEVEKPEVVKSPPIVPAQSEPASLSLDDLVRIVGEQVAAGKISRSALGAAIWKLQQIKQTIPVEKRATREPHHRSDDQPRERAKAVLRQDSSLTKREVMQRAKCGSKAAVLARRELEEAGEIAPKKAQHVDQAKAEGV